MNVQLRGASRVLFGLVSAIENRPVDPQTGQPSGPKLKNRDEQRAWDRLAAKVEDATGLYATGVLALRRNIAEQLDEATAQGMAPDDFRRAVALLQAQGNTAAEEIERAHGDAVVDVYLDDHEHGLLKRLWAELPPAIERTQRRRELECDQVVRKAVQGDLQPDGQFVAYGDDGETPVPLSRAAGRRR